MSANAAGSTSSVVNTAAASTASPAYANERRKYSGKTSSAASASATVRPEYSTVRPAVRTVVVTAAAVSAPPASSSRNRLTMNRLESSATASPSAVVMFNAKIETSLTAASTRSTASAAPMVTTPTSSGSMEATRLPNTSTSAIPASGMAMDSMSTRSRVICLLICASATASPPARIEKPSRLPLYLSASAPASFGAAVSSPRA